MVLSSKLDFNLTLETANSNFFENIFCAIETNVQGRQFQAPMQSFKEAIYFSKE